MTQRIAILTDVHWDPEKDAPYTHMDSILQRALLQINSLKPDFTLILGDLIDPYNDPQGHEKLRYLRPMFDALTMPWLAIPGNHDPPYFFEHFPVPRAHEDVKGMRFLPFCFDEDRHGNRRTPEDLQRLAAARADGFEGIVVAVQHAGIYRRRDREGHSFRRMYYNHDAIADALRRGGVDLAVYGHWHEGHAPRTSGNTVFYGARAFLNPPHVISVLDVARAEGATRVTAAHVPLAP